MDTGDAVDTLCLSDAQRGVAHYKDDGVHDDVDNDVDADVDVEDDISMVMMMV